MHFDEKLDTNSNCSFFVKFLILCNIPVSLTLNELLKLKASINHISFPQQNVACLLPNETIVYNSELDFCHLLCDSE